MQFPLFPSSIAAVYDAALSDLMLADHNRTFTLIPFNINTALRRISSKGLSDIEGCSSRPCQMRSALAIMVRSSGGAASQLHNSLTASVILCSVSIRARRHLERSHATDAVDAYPRCAVSLKKCQRNPPNGCQPN